MTQLTHPQLLGITVVFAILVLGLLYCVYVIYQLQAKHISKDMTISEQKLMIEGAIREADRWERCSIGYMGDIAILTESRDQDEKMKVKNKWRSMFKLRKEQASQKN